MVVVPRCADDDLARSLSVADPEDDALSHIGLVGDHYTVLVSGKDTAGQFTVIDMLVRPEGGPPPHRHDFEETFSIVEGELEVTFRGETRTVAAGTTLNIPANAPHAFRNASGSSVHMLCICSPAGQDAFFQLVGDRLTSRNAAPPEMTDEERAARAARVPELAAIYRTEMLIGDRAVTSPGRGSSAPPDRQRIPPRRMWSSKSVWSPPRV